MDKIIFFTTLVLFPFGQLFKIGIFNLFDAVVLGLAAITLLRRPKFPDWYKYFIYFVLSCVFGLIINYSFFSLNSLLYLVRLVSYSLIAVYISNFYKSKKLISIAKLNHIPSLLISISVASATFGWVQYLLWPDLTFLKYLGWDDHLLRMVGTFLDPTYLGLILVLGVIIALNEKYYKTLLFLAISLLFTYSRASYLALFFVFLFDFFKERSLFKFLILNSIFLILFLVPKNIGEGTTLTRTVSGNSKLENYSQTIEIIKNSPAIGVGFNNICSARQNYLGDTNIDSHGCNGADSSILFLLSTTGIVGFLLFLNFVLHVPKFFILNSSFLALLLHSTFSNSLFYPHIMFWIFVLIGLQTKVDSKS